MKAFVYTKKESKLVVVIENVKYVYEKINEIVIFSDIKEFTFDTHKYKTTVYQN